MEECGGGFVQVKVHVRLESFGLMEVIEAKGIEDEASVCIRVSSATSV